MKQPHSSRTRRSTGSSEPVTVKFFETAGKFRSWLEKHHARNSELWVGFYKVGSGKRSISYKQALDEALCFGWIDGVRKRLDEERFIQRFTPRTAKSYWSAVNTRRVGELKRDGRMHSAGLAAFDRRDTSATKRYSFERDNAAFDKAHLERFRANPRAWDYFQSEAPWYQRVMAHWVTSAKREETRQRRLETLIRDSAAGKRSGLLLQKK